MQNMKIRIHSEEHSRKVQEKLFEMGYTWSCHTTDAQYTDKKHLYAYDSHKYLSYSEDDEYFEDHGNPEYVLHDDRFVRPESLVIVADIPTERPPLGLRPKYVCDSLRVKEILEACSRYAEAGKKIPSEWLDELMELNYQAGA